MRVRLSVNNDIGTYIITSAELRERADELDTKIRSNFFPFSREAFFFNIITIESLESERYRNKTIMFRNFPTRINSSA